MPNIDGGPQEDPNWMVEAVEAIAEKKFDFENIDVKLYLALRSVVEELNGFKDNLGPFAVDAEKLKNAELAMKEFEISQGPLPDWAVSKNWLHELVPGAQLCTKDGRRVGNAYIVSIYLAAPSAGGPNNPYFVCLTDAGSTFTMSEPEVMDAFTIGDWISDPARIIKDFDRHGYF